MYSSDGSIESDNDNTQLKSIYLFTENILVQSSDNAYKDHINKYHRSAFCIIWQ